MKDRFAGKFIVLDGPDGCGKSTQAELLGKWIQEQGGSVCTFRDPGTTVIGEKIREILLDSAHVAMGDNVEVLLYMAARCQLWIEKIYPALEAGKCVVMDRWISSTCAYQGCAGGFGIDRVVGLGKDCLDRLWPDLTIILDVDLATSAKRMDRKLDRMEQKPSEYHKKVREGFLELVKYNDNLVVIDASASIEQVHQQVVETIKERVQPI